MKTFVRVLMGIGIAVAALAILSTATNLVMGAVERSHIHPYGETITVDGGDVNVSASGSGDRTVVLLSGYGTAAPALDFAPLTRELESHYRVVVVERFGYGYSDLDVAGRTVENISRELHATLGELGVEEPILVAHSLAGLYSLDYVNRFPGEVSALVTIDASVPEEFAIPDERHSWERLVSTTGLLRWLVLFDPAIATPDAPAGTYTGDELHRIRRMNIWNYANASLIDEHNSAEENLRDVADLSYPPDLPVLSFVSQDEADANERWIPAHETQLERSSRAELVVLDGGHYLHWTHSREMAAAIRGFLG